MLAYQWHKSGVEKSLAGLDGHGVGEEHEGAALVGGGVAGAVQHGALDDAVDVDRQQLHALGQNQLTCSIYSSTADQLDHARAVQCKRLKPVSMQHASIQSMMPFLADHALL